METAFGGALRANHYPKAALLGVREGIEPSAQAGNEVVIEDDLDRAGGAARAAVHHDGSEFLPHAAVEIVQYGVYLVIHCVFWCGGSVFCLSKSRDIYKVYIECGMMRDSSLAVTLEAS